PPMPGSRDGHRVSRRAAGGSPTSGDRSAGTRASGTVGRAAVWALATLTLVSLAPGSVALAQPAAASWCVAVWYPSSEHPGGAAAIRSNADVIDVVHPFWYTPDVSGALLDRGGARAAEQVAAWHAAGQLVLPSIFAGHWGYLAADLRPAHVAGIVALVEDNGYDGIDIDYEMFA